MWVAKLLMITAILQLTIAPVLAGTVNVYSARQEGMIKPLLDRFTEQTGITVKLETGKPDELLQRMLREGADSPADLLLTTDADYLNRAQKMGLFQPVVSDVLNGSVPAAYREPGGHWFGLSMRARVLMYAKDRVQPADLASYEVLSLPPWKGRVCARSGKHVYNVSLVSAMIAHQGIEPTEAWAKGLAGNFAQAPQGGDRDQIRAVAAGVCDVALVNSYYMGTMQNSAKAEDREVAGKVGIAWPDQQKHGTHVNVSGAGVAKHSRNKDNAVRLLEFLVSEDAQSWYGEVNYEYPVRPGTRINDTLIAFGEFKADDLNLAVLGNHMPAAVRLISRSGWE